MGKEKTPELLPEQRLEKMPAPEEVRTGPIILRTWRRIRRWEPISDQPGWTIQNNAEESALRDLEKPIEQLLSDIHEAHEMRMDDLRKEGHRDPVSLTLYTLKRTASMMAAVAQSNEDLAKANNVLQAQVKRLTCWIMIVTIGLFIIGLFQIIVPFVWRRPG